MIKLRVISKGASCVVTPEQNVEAHQLGLSWYSYEKRRFDMSHEEVMADVRDKRAKGIFYA